MQVLFSAVLLNLSAPPFPYPHNPLDRAAALREICNVHPDGHLGVIILGAGASSRMGRPKLLLPWDGTTVIGRLIAQWRELGVGQIAVVRRPDDTALAAELDQLGLPAADHIINPQPERGMFQFHRVRAAHWTGAGTAISPTGPSFWATSRICRPKPCARSSRLPRKIGMPFANRCPAHARPTR